MEPSTIYNEAFKAPEFTRSLQPPATRPGHDVSAASESSRCSTWQSQAWFVSFIGLPILGALGRS